MEIMLESLGACSMMDVAAIIRKKRKQITKLEAKINAERTEQHPKVFTKVNINITYSPDAELKDLERAVELSQSTYCSVLLCLRARAARLYLNAN
jgi:putative redox protein